MKNINKELFIAKYVKRNAKVRLMMAAVKRLAVTAVILVSIIGSSLIWFGGDSWAGVSRYGIYNNADSLTPGSLVGAVNTPTELDRKGDAFRLLMGVDAAGMGTVTAQLATIDIKGERTCGLTADKKLYCWGSSYSNVPTLVDESGALAGKTIRYVSNGDWHTCVLASDNQIYCWGQNGYGQLGNNTNSYSSTPVAVDTSGALAGKTIVSLSTGITHTCAIASDNQAYCWGRNNRGQLGNNSTTDSWVPVAVDVSGVLSGKSIKQISSGFYHTCAVDMAGLSYCWGSNSTGQLGNNSTTQSLVPVATYMTGVLSGKTVLSISAYGELDTGHTCAIASDNQAYCWGHNGSGRLGDNTTTNSSVPVAVYTAGALAGKTILQINAGLRHTCAVASDRRAYCWGYNTYGQTASGQGKVPGAVNATGALAGKDIVAIGGGARHTCALDTNGQVYCWGYGAYGNMGNGTNSSSAVPVATNPITYIPEYTDDFTLQYAEKTESSCSLQVNGFNSVSSATPIAYNGNPGVADRTAMTSVPVGLVAGNPVPQQYISSNAAIFNTVKRIPSDQAGVWDFSLKDNDGPMGASYCLRIAYGNGTPLVSYTSFPEVMVADNNSDTPFRVYENADSPSPGAPVSGTNQPAKLYNTGDNFRIRMGVGFGATAGSLSYKLQYAPLTGASCSVQGSGFGDVTESSPIAYATTPGLGDRTPISITSFDPVAADENSPQGYVSSNVTPFTNLTNIAVGMTGIWDFSLKDNTTFAEANKTYCLRIVNSDGSDLGFSTAHAQVTTADKSILHDSSFRFYQNADSVLPGAPLAAVDTGATLATRNDSFRIRAGFGQEPNGYKYISSGEYFSCAIGDDAQAYCWGDNSSGQLGNNSTTDSLEPTPVATSGALSGKTIKNISSNDFHACAIASDDQAYCWGANWNGQLGDNSLSDSAVPVAVDTTGALAGKTIKEISGSDMHTCAIASDNQAYCWGYNWYGSLGNNSTADSLVPAAVDTSGVLAGKTITAISTGENHTCAIASDNKVYCWGRNNYGQLGNNSTTQSLVPVAVDTTGVLAGKSIIAISSGNYSNCVMASDNQVYCWGHNNYGQLGNNSTTQSLVPVAVDTTGVLAGKSIIAISNHRWSYQNCVMTSDNKVYCWGRNDSGQLGNNSTVNSSVPVEIDSSGLLGGKTLLQVSVGTSHACVLTDNHRIYCWGSNSDGELGDGSTADSLVAVAVSSKPIRINPSAYEYKLQYAVQTVASCSVQVSGFADVTSSTPIAYRTNQHVADRAAITTTTQDPTPQPATIAQVYISSESPFTTSHTVSSGNIALFDFSLRDNGSPIGTPYCFRIVYADGSTLESMAKYPSVTTAQARYTRPTVSSMTASKNGLVVRGTYDSNYANQLRVKVGANGSWFMLGVSPELSASGDDWALDLRTMTEGLSLGVYDVTAESTTVDGAVLQDSSLNELSIVAPASLSSTGSDVRLLAAAAGLALFVGLVCTSRLVRYGRSRLR